MIQRFAENPIITGSDVKPSQENFEVMCAFNAGATDDKTCGAIVSVSDILDSIRMEK